MLWIRIVFLASIVLMFMHCTTTTVYAITTKFSYSLPDQEESKKINEQKNKGAKSNDDYLQWEELNEQDKKNGTSAIMEQRMSKPNDMQTGLHSRYTGQYNQNFYKIGVTDEIKMAIDWVVQQINNLIQQLHEIWQQIVQMIRQLLGK